MPRLEILWDKSYWKYGFSLTALDTTLKFFTETKEEAMWWYSNLKKRCEVIVLRFSRDFIVGRVLCRSNCSKIRAAASTGNEESAKFTVKSVSVNKIFEDSHNLVLPDTNS